MHDIIKKAYDDTKASVVSLIQDFYDKEVQPHVDAVCRKHGLLFYPDGGGHGYFEFNPSHREERAVLDLLRCDHDFNSGTYKDEEARVQVLAERYHVGRYVAIKVLDARADIVPLLQVLGWDGIEGRRDVGECLKPCPRNLKR